MCWCACVGRGSVFWMVSSCCGVATSDSRFNVELPKYTELGTNTTLLHFLMYLGELPHPRGEAHLWYHDYQMILHNYTAYGLYRWLKVTFLTVQDQQLD